MRSDVDLAYLKRAAAAYLARYAASAAQLERVLQRRVAKRCRISGADPADHAETVKAAVAFCAGAGLVDDAAFAAGRTATRLGPFRPPDARAEKRDKDIAAMMRAGFGFELARATIGRAEESGG